MIIKNCPKVYVYNIVFDNYRYLKLENGQLLQYRIEDIEN